MHGGRGGPPPYVPPPVSGRRPPVAAAPRRNPPWRGGGGGRSEYGGRSGRGRHHHHHHQHHQHQHHHHTHQQAHPPHVHIQLNPPPHIHHPSHQPLQIQPRHHIHAPHHPKIRQPYTQQPTMVLPPPAQDVNVMFGEYRWRLPDILYRFPRLNPAQDFTHVIQWWPQKKMSIPLDVPIPFEVDPASSVSLTREQDISLRNKPPTSPDEPTPGRHVVRVLPLSVQGGDKAMHMTKQIKFLVSKRPKGALRGIGGPWDAVDGKDPNRDAVLVKTGIRHCLEQTGLDLSACKVWLKFFEVSYNREDGRVDRTVFFIPDVWTHFAKEESVKLSRAVVQIETFEMVEKEEVVEDDMAVDEEDKKKDEKTEEKKEEKKEGVPKTKKVKVKVAKTLDRVAMRTVEVSLNGLLEYELTDNQEETFELSLFAESFSEMLKQRFAGVLLEKCQPKVKEWLEAEATRKRKREEAEEETKARAKADEEEKAAKRQKIQREQEEAKERKRIQDIEEKDMTEHEIQERRDAEAVERKAKAATAKEEAKKAADKEKELAEQKKKEEEDKAKAEEERKKLYRKVVHEEVDEELLNAFRYFDLHLGLNSTVSGMLSREALASALYGTAKMSRKMVLQVLSIALPRLEWSSFHYMPLCTTREETEEKIPEEELQKMREEEEAKKKKEEEEKKRKEEEAKKKKEEAEEKKRQAEERRQEEAKKREEAKKKKEEEEQAKKDTEEKKAEVGGKGKENKVDEPKKAEAKKTETKKEETKEKKEEEKEGKGKDATADAKDAADAPAMEE